MKTFRPVTFFVGVGAAIISLGIIFDIRFETFDTEIVSIAIALLAGALLVYVGARIIVRNMRSARDVQRNPSSVTEPIDADSNGNTDGTSDTN